MDNSASRSEPQAKGERTEHVAAKDARRLMARGKRTQPETLIRRQVREYLQLRGWLVKYMMQGPLSEPGIADLYCLRDGRSVWVEIKTPKGRQSDAQLQFEADVLAFGGEYRVVRSVEDVEGL